MAGWLPRVTVLAAALISPAASASPEPPPPERRYWDARLLESAHGDYNRAIQIYRELAVQLDDPQDAAFRARAMLAAGRALRTTGELDEASKTFESCRRLSTAGFTNVDTSACAAGARQVALEQGAIRSLPVNWTFESSEHGFVLFSERGSMSLEQREGRGVLVWTQEISGPQIADLIVAIDQPPTPPRGISVELQAEDDNALMELIVEDDRGFAYALSGKLFRADPQRRTWEISFADLEPFDADWPPLEPERISAVRLRDSTGSQLPELRARHRVVLYRFSLY